MNQTLEYKPKTGVDSIYFLQLFCWKYNGIRKLIKIVIMEISNMSETDSKYLKFKCLNCNSSSVVQEVLVNVTQYSSIAFITEDGAIDYGLGFCEDGEVSHYQCNGCGTIIKDGFGNNITDGEELAEWLKQYCLQDKD